MAKALIVGAGICGPVTAMALGRAGVDATIFEAYDNASHGAGSFLTVAPNGLAALGALDLADHVRRAGFPTPEAALFNGSGKHLGTVSLGRTADGTVSHTVRRANLHRVLHDEACPARQRTPDPGDQIGRQQPDSDHEVNLRQGPGSLWPGGPDSAS